MLPQGLTPKFVVVERYSNYDEIKRVIIRVDHIEYVEVSSRIVYLLNETKITNITRDSMKALEEALLDFNK